MADDPAHAGLSLGARALLAVLGLVMLIVAACPQLAAPVAALPRLHAARGDESDDSERGGDDDFNDACEVPKVLDDEMMGWDTYDDGYVGS